MAEDKLTFSLSNSGDRRRIFGVLAAFLISFATILVLGGEVQQRQPEFSPIDELQHVDSTYKAGYGRLFLPTDERITAEVLRLQTCRGIRAELVMPSCDALDLRPEQFQELGYNTAAGRPSIYYAVTGVLARGLLKVFPDWDYLDAARMANLFGLAFGCALLSAFTVIVSRSAIIGTGLGGMVGLSPAVMAMGSMVKRDAGSILAGTLVLWIVISGKQLALKYYLPLLILTLSLLVLVKPNFAALTVIPVVFALLRYPKRAAELTLLRRLRMALPEFVAAAVVATAYLVVTVLPAKAGSSEPSPIPMNNYLAISETNPWDLMSALGAVISGLNPFLTDLSIAPVLGVTQMASIVTPISLVLFAGVGAGLLMAPRGSVWLASAWSFVAVSTVSALIVLVGQLALHQSFPVPTRYGLLAIPAAAVAIAAMGSVRNWFVATFAALVIAMYLLAFSEFNFIVAS